MGQNYQNYRNYKNYKNRKDRFWEGGRGYFLPELLPLDKPSGKDEDSGIIWPVFRVEEWRP